MQDYTHESCNSYKIILRGLIVHIILVLHNLPKCIKDVKIVYKPGLNTPFSPPFLLFLHLPLYSEVLVVLGEIMVL